MVGRDEQVDSIGYEGENPLLLRDCAVACDRMDVKIAAHRSGVS
jgi:hypothetical protein